MKESAPLATPASTHSKGMKVLILEENRKVAPFLRSRLLAVGYEVESIPENYNIALKKLKDNCFNALVLEVQEHKQEAIIAFAKQAYQELHIPVVFSIDRSFETDFMQLLATYPFGYIMQSYGAEEVDLAIRTILLHHEREQKLRLALQKEKEGHELKSEFLAIASHELRNPIACITMLIDLLIKDGTKLTSDTRQSHLYRGKQMLNNAAQLLNDIALVEQLERKQFECCKVPTNIFWLCQDILEEVQLSMGKEHQLRFSLESNVDADKLYYELDPKLLWHILSNLLSNAIKYSPSGEVIRLDLICTDTSVSFRIQDQGLGIPHQEQAYLFTAFKRATNVGKIPGTGLGLSIVKQCIDAHNGTIDLVSNLNSGTTVTVSLDAKQLQTS